MNRKNIVLIMLFLILAFSTGCSEQKPLTVSEIIQDAETLNGKTVRVRGVAYLWMDPSQAEMWMLGGCVPPTDVSSSSQGNVVGWLMLYDSIDPLDIKNYGIPHDETGIRISNSDFHCNGNYCKMTCEPFEITSQQTYEFVGVLRAGQQPELVLENIDLEQSSQLVNGNWVPLQTGNFNIMFP
jgi:hypothetical protein